MKTRLRRIKTILVLFPLCPTPCHVGPILLGGEQSFFKADAGIVNDAPEPSRSSSPRRVRQAQRPAPARSGPRRGKAGQQPIALSRQRARLVAAIRLRRRCRLSETAETTSLHCDADPVGLSDLAAALSPAATCRNNTFAQIEGIGSSHQMLASFQPAS